nr:11350_t:CDS:2 [Entrophospora candida]
MRSRLADLKLLEKANWQHNRAQFLVSFTPITAITIFSALCKRVEAREWTNLCEKEIVNFIEEVGKVSGAIHRDEKDRLEKIHGFWSDESSKQHVSLKNNKSKIKQL